MSQVVNLATFRRKSRQAFLAKHGGRLDRLVEKFVRLNIDVDFRQLAEDYQAGRYGVEQGSWDYMHFRECLTDALNAAFGKALYELLLTQHWFERQHMSQEEVVDRCLSTYVLSRCNYALVP